jgi:hypothetical protein
MKLVAPEDIVPLKEYDKIHEEQRRRIVEIKSHRRVQVGRFASFVFENFDTVRYQIQEMCRVERISEPDKVRHEIDTYNELIPPPNHLSATLFLEIETAAERKRLLPGLVGIEKAVSLRVGEETVSRSERIQSFVPEEVERPDYASSVHFLRFAFREDHREKFLSAGPPVWLTIDHPNYGASERLPDPVLAELRKDLRAET